MNIVVPGQRLASGSEFNASSGTYIRDGDIYASVVGQLTSLPAPTPSETPSIRVVRSKPPSAVPEIGSIVTGRVLRINPTQATLAILIVGSTPCHDEFRGVIRIQDVRATEKDRVVMVKSFRPGDIVRAEVISLGDARSYYLSTAKNELGVVFATSLAGFTMIPLSWEQMICPRTKATENRKCAKPV
ncbi:hypothetical protein BJ742DRAFT_825647 [Cladochytrium replicatum]|nr:hypothetical protein BJ742DRAFT_825647 [Cladochytrium replicatum]